MVRPQTHIPVCRHSQWISRDGAGQSSLYDLLWCRHHQKGLIFHLLPIVLIMLIVFLPQCTRPSFGICESLFRHQRSALEPQPLVFRSPNVSRQDVETGALKCDACGSLSQAYVEEEEDADEGFGVLAGSGAFKRDRAAGGRRHRNDAAATVAAMVASGNGLVGSQAEEHEAVGLGLDEQGGEALRDWLTPLIAWLCSVACEHVSLEAGPDVILLQSASRACGLSRS